MYIIDTLNFSITRAKSYVTPFIEYASLAWDANNKNVVKKVDIMFKCS